MKVEQTVSLFTSTPFSSDEQTNSLFYLLATLSLITFAYLLNSRNFMDLPIDIIGWSDLYNYLGKLDGAKKTGFLTDNITEVWMDFSFRGHNFSVNNQMGEYWFFSENPECPEEVLIEIAEHCEKLLEK